MTDLELTLKALEVGILPSFDSTEIKQLLETCDPDDARKMKRKFRKLWRRERKKELSEIVRRQQSARAKIRRHRIKEQYEAPARRRRSVKNCLEND